MSISDHLKNNWVEYLLLAVLIFFLGRNKKVKGFVKKIVDKAKKGFNDFLDDKE
jgi:hypothetical protein